MKCKCGEDATRRYAGLYVCQSCEWQMIRIEVMEIMNPPRPTYYRRRGKNVGNRLPSLDNGVRALEDQ